MKADNRKITLSSAALVMWATALCSAVSAHGQQEPPRLERYWVDDALEGAFESPSWDIWSIQADVGKTYASFFLIPAGPFDPNGGETSLTGETRFSITLTDPVTQTSQEIVLLTTDTSEQLWIDGVEIGQGGFGGWGASAIDEGLRLDIFSEYLGEPVVGCLAGYSGPIWLEAELSDTGTGVPDRVAGWVPEPGTLSLLAAGSVGLLARRRRQAGFDSVAAKRSQ